MTADGLQPGSEVLGYRLEEVLGRGGMGTVYKATQLSLGRVVALKVLHAARIRSPQQVEGFLKEARAAGRLNHPHLVLVHDAHAEPARGLYCYSMEYVPGQSLSRVVKERGLLSRSSALHILYQVARALGHAHRHHLVHRDVKPDNILVMANGTAKLADLGLVRDRLEGMASPGSTSRLLTLVGTPEFSAPEQSRNPQKATAASDVYSLGAVLCWMLTGRPPFSGETVIDLIVRAATEAPALPPTVPEDCRQLCLRMLARDPRDRYADGDAVVAALEALAKGQPLPKPVPAPVPAVEDEPGEEVAEDDATQEADPTEEPSATATPANGAPRVRRRLRRRHR